MHNNHKQKLPTDASLSAHLSDCELGMVYGLPVSTEFVFLVATRKDVPAALEFLAGQCPRSRVIGGYVPDHELGGGNPRFAFPLFPLHGLRQFPHARVLLYSTEYLTYPTTKTNGFMLANAIGKQVRSYSLAPDPDPEAWHARRNPQLYAQYGKELEQAYASFEDAQSKGAFASAIKMLLTGDLGYLRPAPFAQYEHPATRVRPGDIILDGGMYSLEDSIRLADAAGQDGELWGFEPEPSLYERIRSDLHAMEGLPSIRAFPIGIGASATKAHIVNNDSGSWLTRKPGADTRECVVQDIDSFVGEWKISKIDVIKFDIEGCELDGLRGAEQTIVRHRPRLMISAYHKYEDLFTLPAAIKQFVPEYKLFFACHHMFAGEFILYAAI